MNEINPHQSNVQMGFGISDLEVKHVKFTQEPKAPSRLGLEKEHVKDPEKHDFDKMNIDLRGSQKSLIKPVENVYVIAAPAEQSSVDEKSNHPYICMLHCAFKILSVFFYFLGSAMTLTPLSISLDIIIFSAFDFWCVKNLSGR